jgi:hypothetical protein
MEARSTLHLEVSARLRPNVAAGYGGPRVMTATEMRSVSWAPIRRAIALLMACETATLVLASLLHFGVTIRLGGLSVHDPFSGAAVPEAIIATALACGTVGVLTRPAAAWPLALGTTVFAVLGFLVGLRFTVFGGGPARIGDIAYHLTGLALLLTTITLVLSPAGRRALHRESPE